MSLELIRQHRVRPDAYTSTRVSIVFCNHSIWKNLLLVNQIDTCNPPPLLLVAVPKDGKEGKYC